MIFVIVIGLALFLLAFAGISKLVPTIFGLLCILGLLFGVYLIWEGVTGGNDQLFLGGCVLMIIAGGILMYLRTSFRS